VEDLTLIRKMEKYIRGLLFGLFFVSASYGAVIEKDLPASITRVPGSPIMCVYSAKLILDQFPNVQSIYLGFGRAVASGAATGDLDETGFYHITNLHRIYVDGTKPPYTLIIQDVGNEWIQTASQCKSRTFKVFLNVAN
jgi:hypothetical protein